MTYINGKTFCVHRSEVLILICRFNAILAFLQKWTADPKINMEGKGPKMAKTILKMKTLCEVFNFKT